MKPGVTIPVPFARTRVSGPASRAMLALSPTATFRDFPSLVIELPKRILDVLPGTMDTPANRKAMPNADFSKWLDPAKVADLALWLADENAGHISGASIPIE